VGGLVTGGVLTAALLYVPEQRRTTWQVTAGVVLVVVLVGLALFRFGQIPAVT